METKICIRKSCVFQGVPQPVDQFCVDKTRKDGLHPYCKTCRDILHKATASKPDVKQRAREAQARYRNTENGRAKTIAYYTSPEYREKANAYQREYSKNPKVKLCLAMKAARYKTRNALKSRARNAVSLALRSKKLKKPGICEWCGGPAEQGELEAHHWRGYDPEHWLDVRFVHAICHPDCEKLNPEDWLLRSST